MNILFRDSEWFLYEHEGDHWIQAKEPMASKIRSHLHHTKSELMQIRSLVKRHSKYSVFRTGHPKLISFQSIWDSEATMTHTKEWLLYIYLDFCLDCCHILHPKALWFDEDRNLIHSQWNLGTPGSDEATFIRNLFHSLQTTLGVHTTTVPYDSAPWSLYHFLRHCETKPSRSITQHPWWTRQELTSNRHRRMAKDTNSHSRLPSFSLTPSALESTEGKQNPSKNTARTDNSPTRPPNSFPLVKGSMIHSPKLKQFENHLSSRRTKTTPSMIHKIIRISSSLLQ